MQWRHFVAFCVVLSRLVRLSHGAGPQGGTASSIMPRCESEKCYLVVTSEQTTVVERRRPRRSLSEDLCVLSDDVSDLWGARAVTAPPTRCRWWDAA